MGLPLAKLLAEAGMKIVAADTDEARLGEASREIGAIQVVSPDQILSWQCDLLAPCAIGGVLDADSIDRLRCQLVYGSANNQLAAVSQQEEIALAETEVAQAQIALEEARLRLERCERRAPFDGTVGMVDVREGEQVQQGDLILTLGDLSTLRVETTDLDEIDVARIAVGQRADITFDAFPDRVFTGRVTRINPMAEPGGGGAVRRSC